jgi:uncharacterized protein (TIGR02996 family)
VPTDTNFDDEERMAARILARLGESGGIAFVSSWGATALVGAAARVLARHEGQADVAEAFGEWLLEQVEVAELFIDDDALAQLIAAEWQREPAQRKHVGARNSELEAALLANPDEPERYLVYGDWLQARGDLYGELIIQQVAAHGPEGSPTRRRLADDFLTLHGETLLGPLAEYVGEVVQLDWWMGFVREAKLERKPELGSDHEGPILLRWLLEQRASLVLRKLSLESLARGGRGQLGEMMAVLVEHPPAKLASLRLGHGDAGEPTRLFAALPGLRELVILCERMRHVPLHLPELRSLTLELGWTGEAMHALAHSQLDRLESLQLLAPGAHDVSQLARAQLPSLRHLQLRPRMDQIETLIRLPLTAQLDTLDLSGSELDDELVQGILMPNLACLRRLRRLDLSDNALGEAAAMAIESALAPGVVVIGEQSPLEADDEDEYYDDDME